MKRDYETGEATDVIFFTGVEVEKTPAYGKKTLFVTGVQDYYEIKQHCINEKIEHIFFGANHSFHPEDNLIWQRWESMIDPFLKEDMLCSLDIPISHAEGCLENSWTEYDNFIPQIRVPLPYIKLWNYNTMIKIDDKGFKATNPGVWCHSLHDLKDREKFTDWAKYGLDKILK